MKTKTNQVTYWRELWMKDNVERLRLKEAIEITLKQNAHLADGDVCTLKILKDSIREQRPCSTGSFPARQDALDWQVFAAAFEKRNGFVPHPMDTGHKEYFHWFTVGAHEEFMGRFTVKPNA